MQGLVDREVASLSGSAEESLALAGGRALIPDPPEVFGTIRPKRVRTPVDSPAEARSAQHVLQRNERAVHDLDDDELDDERPPLDFLSSPVGGGGPIGRLLKRLLGDVRSGGSGAPGADAPTHRTRRSTRVARLSAVTTGAPSMVDDAEVVAQGSAVYPEWDVFGRRYRRDWCTVVERAVEPVPGTALGAPDAHALRRALRDSVRSSSDATGSCKVTTSTLTLPSKPSSRAPPELRPTTRSMSTPSGRGASCRCSCCSTSRARPASPPRRAEQCTSTSERLLPASSARFTTSVTGSPCMPSVHRDGWRSRCCR